MFYNNLKFAFRSLLKNKIYTTINLFGLAIGIAATLLIFRMVNYELSFNKNFKNYDRIVRVTSTTISKEEGKKYGVCVPIPAIKVVKNTVSQFEAVSPIREMWADITIPNPNGGAPLKKFGMKPNTTAFFTETSFFKIFDFKWLLGDPATALDDPGSIVLTRNWAEKCFDNINEAIGRTVLLNNITPVVVKGVLEDLPTNCDFNFPFLISYKTVEANADLFLYNNKLQWGSCSSNDQIFALLQSTDQWDAANAVVKKVGEKEYAKGNEEGRQHFHNLQALSNLHYNTDLGNSGSHVISKTRINVLGFIGLLILIMACFNFINLATAQS
ncbi:MAG TPA: hypothetical protein ENI82_02520, partial [Bacteroidetes bacterium]|nr:hypothetical protein [Bacteroidota bacterium]